MTKWEYKIVKINILRYISSDMETNYLEDSLNKLGSEGWELINLFDLNLHEGKSSYVIVSLKRPIQEAD